MAARRGVAPMVAGFLLAVLPLVARNLAVGAPPLAVAASGPHAFLYYNAADYDAFGGAATSAYAPAIMARTEGRWLPVVIETLRTHPSPLGWLRLLGAKLAACWHWLEVPDNASYYYYRLEAPRAARLFVEFWLIAPLAAAGVVAGARRRHPSLLVLLYIATGVAGNVLFYTSSRLRLPLAIAMTPFAGLGLAEIVRSLRARRWARLAALGVVAAVATAVVLRLAPPAHTGLRVADFGVANEITLHLAGERAATGDGAGALRLLERRLATEPVELRALDPRGESHIPILAASVAGSFAQLHELAATLPEERGAGDAQAWHAGQARLLRVIAAQLADAQGRGLDPSEGSGTRGR